MGLGDALSWAGDKIETGSDWVGADWAGRQVDNAFEATGELLDDSGLDNIYDPVWKKGIVPALHTLETKVWQPVIQRPLTTMLIQDDWTDDWSESWAASKHISPGQAFVAALGNKVGDLTRPIGVDPDVFDPVLGDTADITFDIRNKEMRDKVFKNGLSGASVFSGSMDATLRWFADPLVLGGKAIAKAHKATVTKPLNLGKLDDEAREAKLDRVVGDPTTAEMTAGRRLEAYSQHYFRDGMDEAKRRGALINDRNFKDNVHVAEFLARASTPQEFKLRMRVAMNPSLDNLQFMQAYSRQAREEYTRLRETRLPSLELAMDDIGVSLERAMETGDPAIIAAARRHAAAETKRLREAVREIERAADDATDAALGYQAALDPLKNTPRRTLAMKAGDSKLGQKLAESEVGARWAVYQPNRYSAVRVLRSVASRQAGVIIHDQPDSAGREIAKFIDRAGHGVLARGSKGIPQELRDQWISEVNRAAYGGSVADLQAAVSAVEQRVITWQASQLGISGKVASELIKEVQARRTATLKTIISGRARKAEAEAETDAAGNLLNTPRPEGVFSGAKLFGDELTTTRFADQFELSDGVLQSAPLMLAQMENATPLIDLDVMTKLLRRERYTLTDPDEAGLLARLQHRSLGHNGVLPRTGDSVEWFLEQFNRAWKPAQLFRLGWPIRVVTDENMRSMAAIGALTHLRLGYKESLANSLAQGNFNYRLRDLATAGRRRLADKRVKEMDPARAQGAERLGVVDELAAALTERATLVSRLQEARDNLDIAVAANAGARVHQVSNRATLGNTFVFNAPPNELARYTHTRVLEDLPPEQMWTTTTREGDLGRAYLTENLGRRLSEEAANQPPVRVLITGSRDWDDAASINQALQEVLDSLPPGRQVTIVHGGARGADTHAGDFARNPANRATEERRPANWGRDGRRAGFVRNQEMVDSGADVVLAFIRNGSNGATHAARQAEAAGIPVRRYRNDNGVITTPQGELPWGSPVVGVEQLESLTRAQMVAHIQREFPDAKLAKYRTKDALLNHYGELAAKADGYRALQRDGDRLTVLDESIVRKVDPAEERWVHTIDEIEELELEQAALIMERTQKRDALTEWSERMEETYNKHLSRAAKPSSRVRGEDGRPLKFSGNITLTHNGVSIERPDAFAGAYGRMFMDLASAASTTRALANIDDRYLNGLRVTGGDTTTLTGVVPTDISKQKQALLRNTYNAGWERAVNDQIGKDVLARRIIEGKTDEEILTWMDETVDGQEYMRKMASLPVAMREEWLLNLRTHIDQYLPDENLKALALQGRATHKDLRLHNETVNGGDPAALPIIHAQSLDLALGSSPLNVAYSQFIDTAYAKLGTAPTDVLSRHPFFASIYRREMQHRFEGLNLKADDMLDEVTWGELERNARQIALREVKRTMYDVANQSNMAHTMRFLMPFYAAWQDALQTWSRLWLEDPSRLAHMYQVWEAPKKTNVVYEDANGEKYLAMPLPKAVRERLGLTGQMGMPADWVKNLIFQGEYWYNPGVGVPVTVPVGAIVRDRPEMEELLRPLVPYGAGDSWKDQILPAGWKRGDSLFNAEDDEDYAKAQFRLFQDVYTKNRLEDGDMTDIQMWDEAKRQTNDLFRIRMASNFLLPFSPQVKSPYQFYIDSWRKMQEDYRADPQVFGGRSAQDAFIDEHGEDYFVFTLAATKSNVGGIAPTIEGYHAFNEYRDLVREMPEMGSLIVGDTAGEYSGTVAQWMLDTKIGGGDNTSLRDIRDPKSGLIDAQVNRGWTLFRQIDDATDAALAERGLKSLRSKGAADIKLMRDVLVGKIKEQYPHWAAEFGTFDRTKQDRRVAFMTKLVEDPRVADRPGFRTLTQYLALRKMIADQLASRPSKNLQAEQNADLKAVFDLAVGKMRQSDLDFATLHTRWLNSDDLDTGGVV